MPEDSRQLPRQTVRKPDDPSWPALDLDNLSFLIDEGVWGEVRDASTCTRGEAIAFYASETTGRFTDVRCVVRYVLLFTRQDVWDNGGRDQWVDDHINQHLNETGVRLPLSKAWEESPTVVPDDWMPHEGLPCWSTCRPDHPRAQKAWMCETKGDNRIPDHPKPEAVGGAL